MKYLLAFILLCSPAFAQVQQWDFQDDPVGASIAAAVGTAATRVGAPTSTTGPGGYYAKSINFDGAADWADITASALSYTSGQAWSISLWAKFDASSGPLIGRTSQAPGIWKNSDTVIQVRDGSANTRTFTVPNMGTTNWHHFLITRTTGNSLRVFMDGEESSTTAQSLPGTFAPQAIAYRQGGFFDGRITGVEVFADDQSANVASLYSKGITPVNTVAPSVSGTLEDGQTLTADDGTWNVGTTTARQWRKASDGSGTGAESISGATSSTYSIDTDSLGAKLWVSVRATRTNGQSVTADSAWYEVIDEEVTLYDMAGLPSNEREIYDVLIDLSNVDGSLWGDSTQLQNARDAVEDLTPNSALSQFDFSGISVATWKHNRRDNDGNLVPDEITPSLPVTMVSATHGIASGHNGPKAGELVYFRAPDGTGAVGTVSAIFDYYGDARLIRFTANPGAELKRYPILDNVADCIGRNTWWPDQDLTLRLRTISSSFGIDSGPYAYGVIDYGTGSWGNVITSGSGRPAMIALTNGDLVVAGTIYTPYRTTWSYHDRDQFEDDMNGETLTLASVPSEATTAPLTANPSTTSARQFNPFQFGRGH
jgi:hypothetical protein